MSKIDEWYVHGAHSERWNKARPRANIGNNNGQTKLFVSEQIPDMGPDASWSPLVDQDEVLWYEGMDGAQMTGPEAYM